MDCQLVTKCLAKMSAFGVGLEIEQANDFGSGKGWHRSSMITGSGAELPSVGTNA